MAEISEEKRKLMNELYHQAIWFRKRQLQFFDQVNATTLKRLQDEGDALERLLTRINNGKNPVGFESAVSNVCATAALLAGGESHHD